MVAHTVILVVENCPNLGGRLQCFRIMTAELLVPFRCLEQEMVKNRYQEASFSLVFVSLALKGNGIS